MTKNENESTGPHAYPFACSAHSFACSALLTLLARSTALICLSLAHPITVFCLISAPGAFEIRIKSLLLFTAILPKFFKKLLTFLLILCNWQSQKKGGALIRGVSLLGRIWYPYYILRYNPLAFCGKIDDDVRASGCFQP